MARFSRPTILVAHQRAPVQRLLRTNLQADGFTVDTAASPGSCLRALAAGGVGALVLNAELIRGDRPESAALLRFLLSTTVPTLLLSWDPGDWTLARTLHDAPFLNRPDDVDRVLEHIRELTGARLPA